MEKDMTVGNPTRIIINFAFSIFIGNVFMQLYNMVDTVIVGRFVGAKALAAVGDRYNYVLYLWIFIGTYRGALQFRFRKDLARET